MAGLKLSAQVQEEVDFLDGVLRKCDHLASLVEQYAGAKKGADMYASQLARELGHLRQQAMIKNLGFVADAAGGLGVAAGRSGSQMMKARTLRDGIVSFRALCERTIKAKVATDRAEKAAKKGPAAGAP